MPVSAKSFYSSLIPKVEELDEIKIPPEARLFLGFLASLIAGYPGATLDDEFYARVKEELRKGLEDYRKKNPWFQG